MGRVGFLFFTLFSIGSLSHAGQNLTIPTASQALELFAKHPKLRVETKTADETAQEGCRFEIYQPTIAEGTVTTATNRIVCVLDGEESAVSLALVPFVYWGSRDDSAVEIPDSDFARELFGILKDLRDKSGDQSGVDYGNYPDYNFDDVSNSYTLHDGPLTAKNKTRSLLFCDQNSDKKRGIYRTNCVVR
jgi:hypothetical protein